MDGISRADPLSEAERGAPLRDANMSSRLVAGLLITNITTLACVALWAGAWDSLKRRLRALFEPRLRGPSETTEALGNLLGRDYVPPLPEPVAHVLNRACLCFLATANEFTPHLSLMRFTYCKSLREPGSEVLVLSTRRDTLKYQTLMRNSRVALLVHDFVSEGDGDERNYEVAVTGGARYSITLNGCVTEETGELGAPPVAHPAGSSATRAPS